MDDVAAFIVQTLLDDETIAEAVGTRIGPEAERASGAVPAITYQHPSGVAEDILERPTWKLDVWVGMREAALLQTLTDAIDAVLREAKARTTTGRRIAFFDRDTTWFDVPDVNVRHRTSFWRMVTITTDTVSATP